MSSSCRLKSIYKMISRKLQTATGLTTGIQVADYADYWGGSQGWSTHSGTQIGIAAESLEIAWQLGCDREISLGSCCSKTAKGIETKPGYTIEGYTEDRGSGLILVRWGGKWGMERQVLWTLFHPGFELIKQIQSMGFPYCQQNGFKNHPRLGNKDNMLMTQTLCAWLLRQALFGGPTKTLLLTWLGRTYWKSLE